MSNTIMHIDLKTGIRSVSKQVNLDMNRVSSEFLSEINDICEKLLTVLARTSVTIKKNCKRVEISASDIQAATNVILPATLSEFAIREGNKATFKFVSNDDMKGSRSARAGLVISVPKVDSMFRYIAGNKIPNRFSQGSIIFMTAVIEYVIAELCEVSGREARSINATTIFKRHLDIAVEKDEELMNFLKIMTAMS